MTAVLVTGASGFVGGHLTRALVEQGHQVRCTVRKTSRTEQLEQLPVELFQADVLDQRSLRAAVSGVDLVFHAAARLSAFRSSTMFQVNGHGTANVARICARQPTPPVLVLVSSIAAAGPTRRGELRTERDRPTPISNYGCSKRAGEIAAQHFANRVPTTIVRPGIVYGPGDSVSLLPMCKTIDRLGIHFIAGLQSPPLSFIHVTELVDLLIRAAERGKRLDPSAAPPVVTQGCYFATGSEYPTYFQFGRMLHSALGRTQRTRYWHFPLPLPWLIGAGSECLARLGLAPDLFNIDKVREAVAESWACSAATARHELGFRPHGSLADQLSDTIRWYREQGWL